MDAVRILRRTWKLLKKNQSELRNTIPQMKNALQGINSRLSDWISQVALVVKNPTTNTGDIRDPGSISGLARYSREENGNPLQHSCLENLIDRGTWQAPVHGVAKSQTRLEWLSMHTSATGEHISDLEDDIMKSSNQNSKKKTNFQNDSLTDLWDNIKCTIIRILGGPKGEEREKRIKNAAEETMAEHFLNLKKETDI